MNLSLLHAVAAYCKDYEILSFCKRIGENLFSLGLYSRVDSKPLQLYCDMRKGQSGIFMSEANLSHTREFQAPFDKQLARFTNNAILHKITPDSQNRILHLYGAQQGDYKSQKFILCFEFTGRHTNVILCDEHWRVIEALRHIGAGQSFREVRLKQILSPLPQPTRHTPIESIPLNSIVERLLAQKSLHFNLTSQKQALITRLKTKQEKLQNMLKILPLPSDLEAQSAQYAYYGETLFNALHTIKHFHQGETLTLKDIHGKPATLPTPAHIDSLPKVGNWYFNMSKKLHKKALNIDKQQQNLREKIAFLSNEIALVMRDESAIELISHAHKSKNKREIGSILFINGYKVAIGRSGKENQQLLEKAKGEDLWFHIRDVPSAHLVIFCGKKLPPKPVIEQCGEILCKLYASHHSGGHFVVDYTKRRFVSPAKNGAAVYGKYQSLHYKIL